MLLIGFILGAECARVPVHGGGSCAGGRVGRAAVPGRRGGAASRQRDAGAPRQILALRARQARTAKELCNLISGTLPYN